MWGCTELSRVIRVGEEAPPLIHQQQTVVGLYYPVTLDLDLRMRAGLLSLSLPCWESSWSLLGGGSTGALVRRVVMVWSKWHRLHVLLLCPPWLAGLPAWPLVLLCSLPAFRELADTTTFPFLACACSVLLCHQSPLGHSIRDFPFLTQQRRKF